VSCSELGSVKGVAELFAATFEGGYEDDAPWDAVRELRWRNTDEVFQLAAAYCRSDIAIRRARGLDVLGQLGAGRPAAERPHFDECVSIAIAHLGKASPIVAHSAAWALAHLQGDSATSALIGVRKCADAQVRWAVSVGVAGSERQDAISTLLELMEDEDDDVRNWATFGLGTAGSEDGPPVRLGTLDSTTVRDALRRRTTDRSAEVRNEAVWGLVRRKDPTAIQLLLDRLCSEEWISGDEMMAAEILDLDYNTPVETLRSGLSDLLQSIIQA
jgi:hypothetical protein